MNGKNIYFLDQIEPLNMGQNVNSNSQPEKRTHNVCKKRHIFYLQVNMNENVWGKPAKFFHQKRKLALSHTKCTFCILSLHSPTCIVRPQREVKREKESLQILRDNRPPTKKEKKIEGKTGLYMRHNCDNGGEEEEDTEEEDLDTTALSEQDYSRTVSPS